MATAVFRAYRDYTTLQAEFMYNTLADTAVPGRDYTHVEGKAIIPVDSASVDIPVNIVDKKPNRLPRSFYMQFHTPSQGTMIGTKQAKCMITSQEDLSRLEWGTQEERMFHPRYWVTNCQPTESTSIKSDNSTVIVTMTARTMGGMSGAIWETVDTYDHFGVGYDDHYEMRNTKLWFRVRFTNALDFTNPGQATITVTLVDGTVVYVRMSDYAFNISDDKTTADIHLNFEDCLGVDKNNYLMAVDPRQVRKILIPLMPKDYVANSTDVRTTNVDCELRIDMLEPDTGWKYMQLNNLTVEGHDLRACTAYDDMWNVSPARVLYNLQKLGYRGRINHYCGMSHYYNYTWSNTTHKWEIDRTGALNKAAQAWHDDFAYNLTRYGFTDAMFSVSMELYSDACPLEWTQREWDDSYAKTGYTPCSYLLSPCIEEGMTFLLNVFKNFAQVLKTQNLPIIMQIGEPWWWYNTDSRRPCIYDYTTKEMFYNETGEYALDIGTIDNPLTGGVYDRYITFCRNKFGQRIATLSAGIKAAFPGAQVTVLVFYPTIVGTVMEKLNLPDQYKKESGVLDFFCSECYDWVMNGEIEHSFEAIEHPRKTLGWNRNEIHYLAGFVPGKDLAPVYGYDPEKNYQEFLWRVICGNICTTEYRYPEVQQYVWAYPQLMNDSITFSAKESTVVHMGQTALRSYTEDVTPPDLS